MFEVSGYEKYAQMYRPVHIGVHVAAYAQSWIAILQRVGVDAEFQVRSEQERVRADVGKGRGVGNDGIA